jgi:hypothetical protein
MNTFFQELKRRHVFKAGIFYVVVAWAILQVAAIVFPIILPEEKAIPISEEALYGQPAALDIALIYTMLDEPDLALNLLEVLFKKPSYWSVTGLENDAHYRKLNKHLRFKQIVETCRKPFI